MKIRKRDLEILYFLDSFPYDIRVQQVNMFSVSGNLFCPVGRKDGAMASSVMTLQTIESFCLRDSRILRFLNMGKKNQYILNVFHTAHR